MWNPDTVYAAEQVRWAELQAEGARQRVVQVAGTHHERGAVIPALAAWVTTRLRLFHGMMLKHLIESTK